ncbi:24818_t:CDS:2, partial [Dentiscutata erythropus]
WKSLMQLKVLLEPYMALLNKLQQDKDHLTEVLHSFGWHKKVLAICQLRSELLRLRNITAIDKLLKTYKQKIGIPPKNNEQISLEDDKEELLDNNIDNDIDNIEGQSQMNIKQPEIVSLDEYEEEVMLQDDIHPTDNLAAKWKLADIFANSLAQPTSINLLLGD